MIKIISETTESPSPRANEKVGLDEGSRESPTTPCQVRSHLESWVLSRVPHFSKGIDLKTPRGD